MSLSWSSLESHSSGIEGGRGKGGEVDAESGELPAEDRSEALPLVSLDECPRTSARYQAKPPARWSRLSALPLRESRSEFGLEQKAGNMRSRWLAEEMGTLLAFPSGVTGDGIGGPADRARMGMGIGADGASSIIAASPLTCARQSRTRARDRDARARFVHGSAQTLAQLAFQKTPPSAYPLRQA